MQAGHWWCVRHTILLIMLLTTTVSRAGQCQEKDAEYLAQIAKGKDVAAAVHCLASFVYYADFSTVNYMTDLDFNLNATTEDKQLGRRVLIPLLNDKDKKLRCDAAATLGRYGVDEAFDVLATCPFPLYRKAAAMAAFEDSLPAVKWAVTEFDGLSRSGDVKRRRGDGLALLNLLAHIGSIKQNDFLSGFLVRVIAKDPDPELRHRATAVLKLLKSGKK